MKAQTGLALVLLSLSVNALHFKATGHHLLRRDVQGSSALNDSADISYYTNITLNGQQFTVLIDTGSADLWVAGTVPNAVDSGATTGVQYAVGAVQGPIKFASLDFAGYTVSNQAFLEVTPDSSNAAGTGLIGLGPVGGSNIYGTLQSTQGAAALDRIFLQNTSTPNYLTVLLGRTDDPLDIFSGDLSVGETLEGYSNITSQPKIDVSVVPVRDAGDQHFQVLVDANGIIGPDRKSISVTTEVTGTSNKNQLTAVFDTGFSLSQVPQTVSDAFYSRFSGAEFVNVTGIGALWLVPCNLEVNITFKLGGQSYNVHPMDATLDPTILGMSTLLNSQGAVSCLGMFQPMSFDTGSSPDYDMILGMSFIRNVYALFNFGDFVAGSTSSRGDPYLQLLSTTNAAQAHSDFVSVRLGGVDTTGSQTLSASTNSGSNASHTFFSTRSIYLIIAVICFAAAVVIAIVWLVVRHQRRRRGGKYKQLQDPNMQIQMRPPQGATYNPDKPYDPPSYQNPWDHHY